MSTLHQYISVIGLFQGCLLFFLLVFDSRVSSASKVLGVFCLLIGLMFFLPFLTAGLAPEGFHWMAAWMFFIPLCYGPLLYIYCRNSIVNRQIESRDLVHFLPLLACYLFNIDTLLFANEEIRRWITSPIVPSKRIWLSEYVLFLVGLSYAVAMIVLLKRYKSQADDTLSNFNPEIFKWLWTIVLSTLIVWCVKGIMAFTSFATPVMIVLSDIFLVALIYIIAFAQWRNPALFTIEQLSQIEVNKEQITAKSSDGLLDKNTRAKMFEVIKQTLEEDELYRDNQMTLAVLASATGIGTHQLSAVINQEAGKNFNQFINSYRISDVCKKLTQDGSINILDIAMEAGFSSKSTFNTIFKKMTGSTPTQYRRSLKS